MKKNDADILIRSEYNTKVSFVVDGTTYKGRTYFVFGQNELKNSLPFQARFAEAMKFQLKFIAHQRAAIRLSPIMILLLFYFAAWRFLLA